MRLPRGNVILLALFTAVTAALCASAQEELTQELNTMMMESTFKVEGEGSTGTSFILVRPIPGQPTIGRPILITAAHVLRDAQGENVKISFRRKGSETQWTRVEHTIRIRSGQLPVWTEHPSADVAVMYVNIPAGAHIPALSTSFLADEKTLSEMKIHPGDEIRCLGYPFGIESNDIGFPILRSGRIASYPLLPTRETKKFLLDFRVFKGNSGGPAYLESSGRVVGRTMTFGSGRILGLVSKEINVTAEIKLPYSTERRDYQLGVAEIVPSTLISETLDLLPDSEPTR